MLIEQYSQFCRMRALGMGESSDKQAANFIVKFQSFTLDQILEDARRVERWSADTLAFVSVIVDKCIARNLFEFANTLLEVAHSDCANCKKAQHAVITKGLDLIAPCIRGKQFGVADDCLRRAFYFFPNGSEEQLNVARRGFDIIEACTAWGDYRLAALLLQRSAGLFFNCSIEELQTKDDVKKILESPAWLNWAGIGTKNTNDPSVVYSGMRL